MSDPAIAPETSAPYFTPEKVAALREALKERFDMAEDDATEVAGVVAEQFGEAPEVNDENLDPTVRSIFYTLEAKKILSFRREEYTWETGERRRGFWWRLREEEIVRHEEETRTLEVDVYDTLPRSVWARQNA
jgi:hypothetical protein